MATSNTAQRSRRARPAAKAAPAKAEPAKAPAPEKAQPAKKAAPEKKVPSYAGDNKQPNAESQLALRSSDKWQRIANARLGQGWNVAWSRPEYGMFKTGVRGEWATVCIHGTVKKVAKGSEAEQAGRDRATWCEQCKTPPPAKKAPAVKAEAPKPGPAKKAAPAKASNGNGAAKSAPAKATAK